MVVISQSFPAKDETPVDWDALKRAILAGLDVYSEYEALGLQFVDSVISIKGWRQCHAIDRTDAVESAAVNQQTWIYHDRGGSGTSLNFFDFALRHGTFGSWIDCVRHYADKAGVPIGGIKRTSKGGIEEQVYEYRDAAGEVSYGVFRYRLPNGKKDFRQYPLKGGEWLKERGCMDGVAPLPYKFPELLAAADDEPILCLEGEKDVERAHAHALVATTSHQGAGSSDKTWGLFAASLPRRDYYVIPDHDPGGRLHAQRVCAHLHPVARSVRYLVLPGLPAGGDLSDWFDLGGTAEELGRLMHAAPAWTPAAAETIAEAAEVAAVDALDEDATAADLIRLEATVRWVIPGWVPVGVLTALASEPGCGKTRLCADLLKIAWFGLPTWPDGQPNTLPPGGRALWVAADNQHPELGSFPSEFGFPPEAIVLNATRREPFGGTMLDALEDLHDFEKRIRRVKPVFVFVDTSLGATDRSSSKPEDAKAFFKPLQEIAARTQTAIICVTHLNADGKPLGRRIQGQVRVVISMSWPDPQGQPKRRKLWVTKSNSLMPPALGVTMGDAGNTYDFSPPKEPAPEGGRHGGNKGPSPQVLECAAWLRAQMAGVPAVMVRELRTASDAAGYPASALYAAKTFLQIAEEEIGSRKWWRLPGAIDDDGPAAGPPDEGLAF